MMDIKVGYIVMSVGFNHMYERKALQACCQNTEEEALRWITAELAKPETTDKAQFYIRKVYMRTPKNEP